MAIGDRIRTVRETRGQSQKDFGTTVGASERAVQYWEANKRKPNATQLAKLCAATGLGADYFIFGDDKEAVA